MMGNINSSIKNTSNNHKLMELSPSKINTTGITMKHSQKHTSHGSNDNDDEIDIMESSRCEKNTIAYTDMNKILQTISSNNIYDRHITSTAIEILQTGDWIFHQHVIWLSVHLFIRGAKMPLLHYYD